MAWPVKWRSSSCRRVEAGFVERGAVLISSHQPQAAAAPGRGHWLGTLKARLIIASVLVIACSVLGSASVLLARVQTRAVQAVQDLEADHIERLASLVGQRVVAMQNMLRVTADAMPLAARGDAAAALAFLADKPALRVSFDTVFVADAAGHVLALGDGNLTLPSDVNLAGRDYFIRTVSQGVPVVSSPIVGRAPNSHVIMFTMPVFDARRNVQAVLGGSIRLAKRNLLDDLTFSPRGAEKGELTVVTDEDGTVVSHPDRDRIGGRVDTEPLLAEAASHWVSQGRPIEPSALVLHQSGAFVSMAGVPGADWMLFRVTPDAQLLGGMVQARREAWQWAGGVALSGGLFIAGLLTWLLGPLTRLRQRVRRLHETDLALDEGWPTARGEIGELSDALRQALLQGASVARSQDALMKRMHSIMAAAPIGIAFSRDRRFELVSAEFAALLGWTEGTLEGREARTIYAAEADYDALGPLVAAAFAAGQVFTGERQFCRRDGGVFWGRLQGSPVDAKDPSLGAIWLLEDVTTQRAAHERLSWSAEHDPLTRLLNRTAFDDRLARALQGETAGTPATLMFIDLDHFKRVNDSAGHAAGDGVLKQVADLLHDQVRAGDAAARLGGDEFALLLSHCSGPVAIARAEHLCQAIQALGVDHRGQWLGIGASIGVVQLHAALAPDPASWIACADEACYGAKRAGRGQACVGLLQRPAAVRSAPASEPMTPQMSALAVLQSPVHLTD